MNDLDRGVVRSRVEDLRRRIALVERRWSHDVDVMFVTKGFPGAALGLAADLGATTVGENYAQELAGKAAVLDELGRQGRRPRVAFIGRLQSNKVRLIAGLVDVWSSVDRASLVTEIARRAPGARVLIQVNATGEEHKGGCRPDDTATLVETAQNAGLAVRGLMTVGPTDRPPEDARPVFDIVRGLVDELGLEECSMGMSADLEVAVSSGSTQVRVGTAVFGQRA